MGRIGSWIRVAALGGAVTMSLLSPAGGAETGKVRAAAVAGSWYPERPSLISVEVDRMVRAARVAPVLSGKPVVMVVPHAGWRFSGIAAAAAYRQIKAGDFDRVVAVGPSHSGNFSGFSIAEVSAYRTPLGDVPLCDSVVADLMDGKLTKAVPGVHEPEHSLEIELPFLQERLERFCLVPILAGITDAGMQKALAEKLARLDDGRTLFLFSSDFTHYGARYGYTPFGTPAGAYREQIRELDTRALSYFSPPDAAGFRAFLRETGDTICGREGLSVMLELLPRIAPKSHAVRLARYTSADLTGIRADDSVSYVALAFVEGRTSDAAPLGPPPDPPVCPQDAPPLSADLGGRLVRLARATLSAELAGGDDLHRALKDLSTWPGGELERLQGVFVTLNRTDPRSIAREGKLRGCIGQIYPAYPLPEAVVIAAAMAALQDPRFPPVAREELAHLAVEVTVLFPPKPIPSWQEIRLGRHGIVLKKGERRAVFLPQVPVEEKWSLEETLSHLSRKAGLPADAWKEGATFEVFEGQKFEEPATGTEAPHGG